MKVLTILFAGLIAQAQTPSGVQRAVVVSAPGHVARLSVASADLIDAEGVGEQAQSGTDRVFLLNGEHATLAGVESGPVLFESSFHQFVPSLSRITDGTSLLPEIERGEPHPSVAAYIDLPGGTFSVGDVYGQQVSFGVRGMERQCLAHAVMFRANAEGDTVEIRTASGFIRVRSSAVLRINNDPMIATGATHFHMYARLLTDASYVAEPMTTGFSCGTPSRSGTTGRRGPHTKIADGLKVAPTDVGPSCSNSVYP